MSEVSLREFLEHKIDDLEDKLVLQRASDQQALQLQANEYERRLKALNNEHERLAAQRAETVNREIWDRFQTEYNTWQQSYEVRYADVITRRELDQRLKEVGDKMELFRTEFRIYKEETRDQLALAKGQAKGLMLAWGAMITILTIAANFILAFLRR